MRNALIGHFCHKKKSIVMATKPKVAQVESEPFALL